MPYQDIYKPKSEFKKDSGSFWFGRKPKAMISESRMRELEAELAESAKNDKNEMEFLSRYKKMSPEDKREVMLVRNNMSWAKKALKGTEDLESRTREKGKKFFREYEDRRRYALKKKTADELRNARKSIAGNYGLLDTELE